MFRFNTESKEFQERFEKIKVLQDEAENEFYEKTPVKFFEEYAEKLTKNLINPETAFKFMYVLQYIYVPDKFEKETRDKIEESKKKALEKISALAIAF